MNRNATWKQIIFDSEIPFTERCRAVFRYQAENSPVYHRFISAFGLRSSSQLSPEEIPLMPIRAFKDTVIISENQEPEIVFRSSGTSGMDRSEHHVADSELYRISVTSEFYRHFPQDRYAILCCMPGYDENPDSSLIRMAEYLIEQDKSGLSQFIQADRDHIKSGIQSIRKSGKTAILFGAAFGLLDLTESGLPVIPGDTHIIETGGMKTHRREITKKELRKKLSEGFGISPDQIHSEYGMCELLSQMYAIGGEWFSAPHWVQVSIRDPENPSRICEFGEEGKIGVIDLVNLYSCPFILTDDLGLMQPGGTFRIAGRWHTDDLRGCNFLIDRD
jgi:hypothetical protein